MQRKITSLLLISLLALMTFSCKEKKESPKESENLEIGLRDFKFNEVSQTPFYFPTANTLYIKGGYSGTIVISHYTYLSCLIKGEPRIDIEVKDKVITLREVIKQEISLDCAKNYQVKTKLCNLKNGEVYTLKYINHLGKSIAKVSFLYNQKLERVYDIDPDKEVKEELTEEVFLYVEEIASFPGGQDALQNYLRMNTNYPDELAARGISGTVMITFIVAADGSIHQARVLQAAHYLLNDEALRVIKGMPKWEAGRIDGEPVNQRYTIPFVFKLTH